MAQRGRPTQTARNLLLVKLLEIAENPDADAREVETLMIASPPGLWLVDADGNPTDLQLRAKDTSGRLIQEPKPEERVAAAAKTMRQLHRPKGKASAKEHAVTKALAQLGYAGIAPESVSETLANLRNALAKSARKKPTMP